MITPKKPVPMKSVHSSLQTYGGISSLSSISAIESSRQTDPASVIMKPLHNIGRESQEDEASLKTIPALIDFRINEFSALTSPLS